MPAQSIPCWKVDHCDIRFENPRQCHVSVCPWYSPDMKVEAARRAELLRQVELAKEGKG